MTEPLSRKGRAPYNYSLRHETNPKPLSFTRQCTAAKISQEHAFWWWLHLERISCDQPNPSPPMAETKALADDIVALHATMRDLAFLERVFGEAWVRAWILKAVGIALEKTGGQR
jgi:hypothetical protein